MASYHLSVKSTSRAKGQSSVAAAAYRSGERLLDERTGGVHDFSRKRGIEQKEIIAPSGAPEWVKNRERIWNAAEQSEKRKDAKVAREFEVALPSELSKAEQQALAREFAQTLADRYGVAVDMAIHRPHRKGDQRNAHAHLLTTTRAITPEGLGAKCRVLDSPKTSGAEVEQLRELWARMQNQALERGGHEVRVDHRTLEAQGLDWPPQIHVGPHATAMERRGMVTDRGEINRAVIAAGKELAEITAAIRLMEVRQQEAARAQAQENTSQRFQNAPGAIVEQEIPEVQKGENRPHVASVRPAQEKAGATRSSEIERVWFAFFDSTTWETRAGSQRILSREQNSPEVQARISLEMPPKCVLSEDGRTWSGVFRDGIEAANYGRAQREQALEKALEKRQAEWEKENKEYIEKKNQEKSIRDQENKFLKKFRNEIYSYGSAVLKEKMVVEKINRMDSKINTLVKDGEDHSENVRHLKWHERLNPFKVDRINKNAKRLDQEHTACLEARKSLETELDEVRKVKDIFWRREAPERKLHEAEKERQRQERARKFEQEKAKRKLEFKQRHQQKQQLEQNKDKGQSR